PELGQALEVVRVDDQLAEAARHSYPSLYPRGVEVSEAGAAGPTAYPLWPNRPATRASTRDTEEPRMNVLITGITGMVGSHLAEYLVAHESGCDVHGLVRWRSPRDNIADVADRITLHAGELRDLNSMVRVLKEVRPERIFHLAAQSYVDVSFQAPADTIHTNVIGTVNLLDGVRIAGIDPLI